MFLTTSQVGQSFAKFEKKKQEALLLKKSNSELATAETAASIKFTDASVCPYCNKKMVLSSINASYGKREPVYLCREDRTVAVVPDEVIEKLALDNNVIPNKSELTLKNPMFSDY